MSKLIDLTGKRFGNLIVLCREGTYITPKGIKQPTWRCLCGCGNIKIVSGNNLKSHHVTSCGCLSSRLKENHNKKLNKYDLSNSYGIGYTSQGEEFYFDLEDYDRIKDYCWYIDKHKKYVYARNDDGVIISMHRLIMNENDPLINIDHIKGEQSKNDNRKGNLRKTTVSQNHYNHKIYKNNTSGYTGVHYIKSREKWKACISVENENINLGYFNNKEDAIKARKEAEEKYFGEFSYDNSQEIKLDDL